MATGDDEAIMSRFIADYLALLNQRVSAIQAHLSVGNDMTAQVAMLSLESTSTMVGASEMARIVGALRSALESGDRTDFPGLREAMEAEAHRVPALLTPS